MYRGFNISLDLKKEHDDYKTWIEVGKTLYKTHSHMARTTLDSFVAKENSLDGESIQETWFPQIEADIFLSHSHKDLDEAYALAGNIYMNHGLKTFIDEAIWGHANELLKILDMTHCYNQDTGLFDYNERNKSTAHVHMMLSTALTMMMDKTECILFFKTDKSIQPFNNKSATSSPWLYAENVATKTLHHRTPERLKEKLMESVRNFTGTDLKKGWEIIHPLDIGHLEELTSDMFNAWIRASSSAIGNKLDLLYSIVDSMKTGKA